MRIPVNGSLFQGQAQVVFDVSSRFAVLLQWNHFEGADSICQPLVMEQGTNCCVTSWSQHGIQPFPGFALCSAAFQEDLWGFKVPFVEEWCSKGQRVPWWPMAPPGTGDGKAHRDWARSESRGSAQHHPQPRKLTAWRQLQGQVRKPRGQVQVWMKETGGQMQIQLLCSCSLKSAPAFLLISSISPRSFSAKNSIFQLPSNAMPLPMCCCLPRV